MKHEFGPQTEGIRLGITPDEQAIGLGTANAGYWTARLVGAHSPDSELAEMLFEVQEMGRELARHSHSDHLLWCPPERVILAAMATRLHSLTTGEEESQAAADALEDVVKKVLARTDRAALDAASHPQKDVPANPWGDGDE